MRLPLGEVATDDNDTSTPHSVSISTLLAKLKDSSNDEAYSQVLEEFIIEISRHLDYHNIPCALYGYCLLEVYGIPSDGHSDVSFAVSDYQLQSAISLISNIPGLASCYELDCLATFLGEGPPGPPPLAHLHLDDQLYLSFYALSRTLPNVSARSTETRWHNVIISANDACLPENPGQGRGAFKSVNGCYVRIPTPACFTEACFMNFTREVLDNNPDYTEKNGTVMQPLTPSPSPFDMCYLSCVSYMVDYVFQEWFFDLSEIPQFYRICLVDMFLSGEREGFRSARDRLLILA